MWCGFRHSPHGSFQLARCSFDRWQCDFSQSSVNALQRLVYLLCNSLTDIAALLSLGTVQIYGALPPETRRRQANMFNDADSGYDVLVASDAVGLGLNLNIRRVVSNSGAVAEKRHTHLLGHSTCGLWHANLRRSQCLSLMMNAHLAGFHVADAPRWARAAHDVVGSVNGVQMFHPLFLSQLMHVWHTSALNAFT